MLKLSLGLSTLLLATGLNSFAVHADENSATAAMSAAPEFSDVVANSDEANDSDAARKGPCSKIGLDATQKSQIKDAALAAEKDKITLEASLKEAFLSYRELIEDTSATATVGQAQAASAVIIDARSKLETNRADLRDTILFSILKPEQRKPALACERMMRRRHHHHHQNGNSETATNNERNN